MPVDIVCFVVVYRGSVVYSCRERNVLLILLSNVAMIVYRGCAKEKFYTPMITRPLVGRYLT